MFLIYKGQTTNEHLRAVFHGRRNPDDLGCVHNFVNVCCSTVPSSKIPDQSEMLSEEDYIAKLRSQKRTYSASERSALGGLVSEIEVGSDDGFSNRGSNAERKGSVASSFGDVISPIIETTLSENSYNHGRDPSTSSSLYHYDNV
jgi:hypothetical protein